VITSTPANERPQPTRESLPASSPLRRAADSAALTLAAVAASFLTVAALCRWRGLDEQPAILAALMAISLSRRRKAGRDAHPLRHALAIGCVAPAAALVGRLLQLQPVLGAFAFTAAIALSVYLRDFGARGRVAGALIALPLIAMIVVPPPAVAPGGSFAQLAITLIAGLIALAYATAIRTLSGAWHGAAAATPLPPPVPVAERRARGGLTATARLALQMAVAVGAAFGLGFIAFPAHWGWLVFTAFIVCSGARGRGDALCKGVMRLGGAAAGTLAAAVLLRVPHPGGFLGGCAIFAVLYAGLALREVSYAYWAGAMTLILALLAAPANSLTPAVLGLRLEAILAGALCAVGAAWFVFPIRTEAVIRRRLADALSALDEFVSHAHTDPQQSERLAILEHRLAELDSVAMPAEWHRRLFAARADANHPARWIRTAREVGGHARRFGAGGVPHDTQRARIRRAIGLTRRAVANHAAPGKNAASAPPAEALAIGAALDGICHAFSAAGAPAAAPRRDA
jgi:hypothetical protein